MTDRLEQIHGTGNCPICGKPKRLPLDGLSHCSYPHGMIPERAVDPEHPEGFWAWKPPERVDSATPVPPQSRYFVVIGRDDSNTTRVAACEAEDETAALAQYVKMSKMTLGAAEIAEISKEQYDQFVEKMLHDHGLPDASTNHPTKHDKLN